MFFTNFTLDSFIFEFLKRDFEYIDFFDPFYSYSILIFCGFNDLFKTLQSKLSLSSFTVESKV